MLNAINVGVPLRKVKPPLEKKMEDFGIFMVNAQPKRSMIKNVSLLICTSTSTKASY